MHNALYPYVGNNYEKLHPIYFILVLLSFQLTFSQSITKKTFKKTSWFTSNKDSLFYKSDTLKFIKYSNPIKELAASFEESEYFDDSESIQLKFGRNTYLNFYEKKFHMYSLSLEKWDSIKKDSILKIENENTAKLILKIVAIKELKFIKDNKQFVTTEMLVIKM